MKYSNALIPFEGIFWRMNRFLSLLVMVGRPSRSTSSGVSICLEKSAPFMASGFMSLTSSTVHFCRVRRLCGSTVKNARRWLGLNVCVSRCPHPPTFSTRHVWTAGHKIRTSAQNRLDLLSNKFFLAMYISCSHHRPSVSISFISNFMLIDISPQG